MANAATNEESIKNLKKCVEALAKAVGDQFQRINTISSGNPEYTIEHLTTEVTTDLVAAINSLVRVRNPQRLVESGRLFTNDDDGYDLIFRSPTPITMEVPNGLIERFRAEMFNEGAGQITFVNSLGVNLNMPDGDKLNQNKVATLIKILDENNHILKGELN